MKEARCIVLTFDTIHDVIRAEKILLGVGLLCDLVPTPREISSECGMSVECLAADIPKLTSLRDQGILRWTEIFELGSTVFGTPSD